MAHILVVDDDVVSRRLMGGILESAGHEVAYAGDGASALRLYRTQSFAAVILDVVMPVKNGLETLRELLETDRHARVVMVSGARDGDLALAKELGAIETLQKPTGHEDLLRAVGSAIAR